jgi:CRP/FNR family transcriptional regulator, cyclic AMP receptor protein
MPENALSHLSKLKLFAEVPEAARVRLAAAARPVRFREGQSLFRRGDPAQGMVLVLDGLVRIHLSDARGREVTLALVGGGEPIGEIALIDGGSRSADATALTPVSALLLPHDAAMAMIASDPVMATALLRTMTARVRRLTDQVEAISLQPLAQRLAATLLRLSAADPSGLVRVAQGQLANLVAASRPKVNAALSDYKSRGLVAPVRAGLKLLDPAGLRALAEDE